MYNTASTAFAFSVVPSKILGKDSPSNRLNIASIDLVEFSDFLPTLADAAQKATPGSTEFDEIKYLKPCNLSPGLLK